MERRSIDDARALGGRLLARVAADGAVWAAASVVEEEAVVLGAAQRAARVVDLDACRAAGVRVVRRATAGTAALLAGRSLWLTLALPHVAALVPDATARSLLNRNVRPLLEGLRGLGFPAAYFGREWVSVAKRPAAVLGFDALPEGAVLIEVIVGWDAPVALPARLASAHERATDRLRGKAPCALGELARGRELAAVGERLLGALTASAGPPVVVPVADLGPLDPGGDVERADDPAPPGLIAIDPRPCPIGWIDAAADRGGARAWVGGDGLVPSFVLARVAEVVARGGPIDVEGAPIDGLAIADLVAACEAAVAAVRASP